MLFYGDYDATTQKEKANILAYLFVQVSVQTHITNPALVVLLTRQTKCELRQLRSCCHESMKKKQAKMTPDPRPPDFATPSPGMISLQFTKSARSKGNLH